MVESPAHKLGQIIGDLFEETIKDVLEPITIQNGLYLDYKKERHARDMKKEVIGKDLLGNDHKLDYVIEKGGTEENFGMYIAFIEIAWRRYAKHSKNKAEEIGDVLDVMYKTYSNQHPFKGAVLAGVFTKPSIAQLKSKGITIAYIDYESIVGLFHNKYQIDIRWDEKTETEEITRILSQVEHLISDKKETIKKDIVSENRQIFGEFILELKKSIERKVQKIIVIPLHGESNTFFDSYKAITFLNSYDEMTKQSYGFKSYKIYVEYSENVGEINANFINKNDAIEFIQKISF